MFREALRVTRIPGTKPRDNNFHYNVSVFRPFFRIFFVQTVHACHTVNTDFSQIFAAGLPVASAVWEKNLTNLSLV